MMSSLDQWLMDISQICATVKAQGTMRTFIRISVPMRFYDGLGHEERSIFLGFVPSRFALEVINSDDDQQISLSVQNI
jgi:hypothetical protein